MNLCPYKDHTDHLSVNDKGHKAIDWQRDKILTMRSILKTKTRLILAKQSDNFYLKTLILLSAIANVYLKMSPQCGVKQDYQACSIHLIV